MQSAQCTDGANGLAGVRCCADVQSPITPPPSAAPTVNFSDILIVNDTETVSSGLNSDGNRSPDAAFLLTAIAVCFGIVALVVSIVLYVWFSEVVSSPAVNPEYPAILLAGLYPSAENYREGKRRV